MKQKQTTLSPVDILILLKIIAYGKQPWYQGDLAADLGISQSEVSKSLQRSKYAGLIDHTGKQVMRMAMMDLLQYSIRYIFPQKPGPIVRGMATAHAAPPLANEIQSTEAYIWPYAKGDIRGQSIIPLYPSVPEAALRDSKLYELLALIDALRVGRARERSIALIELKKRIIDGK